MISLARANLVHDWRRHATAIVVLVLAGLLMTIQLGFVLGFMEGMSEFQRQLRADIVVHAKARSGGGLYSGGGSIDPRHEGKVWMHPNVTDVQQFNSRSGRSMWLREDDSRAYVFTSIVDPAENSMTFPRRFPDSLRDILATPGMIVLPRSVLKDLRVDLGDEATVGDTTVIVGGIVNGLSGSFGSTIYVSPSTFRLISGSPQRVPEMFLIRVDDPAETDRIISELNSLLADANLQASRPADVATSSGLSQLLTSGPGSILIGSAIFALVVGCGIASQTLRGAFLAQIKEFGALRALGVSRKRMALVAMEQAWWTGVASIPIAALVAYMIRVLGLQFDIVIALPANLMIGTSTLLLLIALFAGLISLTAVMRVEPAELLK
jgi:putative ABC transport system permease protein